MSDIPKGRDDAYADEVLSRWCKDVTRLEVIDHRAVAVPRGRVLVERGIRVELSLQDDLRTLKVFIQ